MQARKHSGMTPLAIVLPHPPLPRRRSSLLSATSVSSPRTPSCGSPACSTLFFSNAANRKSTDSWNSSNGPDDCDWEWKSEQTLLLARTLDALPSHLITPFNGPVPPSNLLDKVARGIVQAKGPIEWPHSVRATRAKLLEVAKARAKEEAIRRDDRRVIAEESDCDYDVDMPEIVDSEVLQPTTNIQRKRPLYRQSSMDFMNAELKDNERRPLRTDKLFQAFHPYTPNRSRRLLGRSSSPPPPGAVPSLINPSTPSSSTLNSLNSLNSTSRSRGLRRTSSNVSSMSSLSSSSGMCVMPDPRVQRMRKADTPSIYSGSSSGRGSPCMFRTPPSIFNRPLPPTPDLGSPMDPSTPLVSPPVPAPPATTQRKSTKRAPSFGALAQDARAQGKLQFALTGGHKHSNSTSSRTYPSSDEEEKMRSRSAKKVRTRTGAADVGLGPSPSPISKGGRKIQDSANCLDLKGVAGKKIKDKGCKTEKVEVMKRPKTDHGKGQGVEGKPGNALRIDTDKAKPSRHRPMTVQRNPSILGGELPGVAPSPMPLSSSNRHHRLPSSGTQNSSISQVISPILSPSPALAMQPSSTLQAPPTQKVRTLRRVRRLAPSRKISFGSLKPGDGVDGDLDGEGECEDGLGSAFQLK